jgi:hypothetical protein
MSPLSGNPIIAFSFCFINFAARRFLRFLSELMEKHIGIVLVEELQHSIIPRTQFPYAILQMLCDVFAQAGSVVFKDDSKNASKSQEPVCKHYMKDVNKIPSRPNTLSSPWMRSSGSLRHQAL